MENLISILIIFIIILPLIITFNQIGLENKLLEIFEHDESDIKKHTEESPKKTFEIKLKKLGWITLGFIPKMFFISKDFTCEVYDKHIMLWTYNKQLHCKNYYIIRKSFVKQVKNTIELRANGLELKFNTKEDLR